MAAAQVVHFRSESTNSKSPVVQSTSPIPGVGTKMASKYDTITALMLACQQGRPEDVQKILRQKKLMVKERTRTGKVALHFCAESGNMKCLELVLGADPFLINAQDEEGYTPLHLAVITGNRDVVINLISAGADVNCLDNERHSLVHWATVCGEVEILDILLGNGAPATTPDIHLAHPIHYAAQMCGSVNGVNSGSRARVQSTVYGVSPKKGLAILRRLIQHGAPVDVRDQDGRQPLLWASSAGSGDAILSLVNAGAKVDAEDKDGLTALHCAASRGHTDCLETLIALCGSEVDIIDNNGCTSLFYAVTLGHADCTELLLNYGAEPNRQDRKGRTPAHCGASKGQLETIKLLSKHGGNLWLRNVRGDLPLHEAVVSRRKDLVMFLLSQRMDAVNAQNNDGRCPIHLAALNNNVEMVKILIDHRADLNILMRSGKGAAMTALDAAMYRGNSAVAKFLQLHGGLPANSLNDAALQRRLNRSMDSQVSPASSMQSHLSSHHHPSPDDQLHNFTSPEVFESSLGQYTHAHNNVVAASSSMGISRLSPYINTSTPIMDDGVQTDSSHYVRHVDVQVSDEFGEEVMRNMKYREVGESRESNLSSQHRKAERRRRKRSPREDVEESTDSSSTEKSQLVPRTSKKSSRKSRRDSTSGSVSQSQSSNRNSEERENLKKAKPKSRSKSRSKSMERDSRSRSNNKTVHKRIVPQDSSDALLDNTMMSEKFSELENVAVNSSETEATKEDLVDEVDARAEEAESENNSSRESRSKSKSVESSRSRSKKSESNSSEDEVEKSDKAKVHAESKSRSVSRHHKSKSRSVSTEATQTPERKRHEHKKSKDHEPNASNRTRSPSSKRSNNSILKSRTPSGKRSSVSWHDEESKSRNASLSSKKRDTVDSRKSRSKSKSLEVEDERGKSKSLSRSGSKSKDDEESGNSEEKSATTQESSEEQTKVTENEEEEKEKGESKSPKERLSRKDKSKKTDSKDDIERESKSKSRSSSRKREDDEADPKQNNTPEKNESDHEVEEKADKRKSSVSPKKLSKENSREKSRSSSKELRRSESKDTGKSKSRSPSKDLRRSQSKDADKPAAKTADRPPVNRRNLVKGIIKYGAEGGETEPPKRRSKSKSPPESTIKGKSRTPSKEKSPKKLEDNEVEKKARPPVNRRSLVRGIIKYGAEGGETEPPKRRSKSKSPPESVPNNKSRSQSKDKSRQNSEEKEVVIAKKAKAPVNRRSLVRGIIKYGAEGGETEPPKRRSKSKSPPEKVPNDKSRSQSKDKSRQNSEEKEVAIAKKPRAPVNRRNLVRGIIKYGAEGGETEPPSKDTLQVEDNSSAGGSSAEDKSGTDNASLKSTENEDDSSVIEEKSENIFRSAKPDEESGSSPVLEESISEKATEIDEELIAEPEPEDLIEAGKQINLQEAAAKRKTSLKQSPVVNQRSIKSRSRSNPPNANGMKAREPISRRTSRPANQSNGALNVSTNKYRSRSISTSRSRDPSASRGKAIVYPANRNIAKTSEEREIELQEELLSLRRDVDRRLETNRKLRSSRAKSVANARKAKSTNISRKSSREDGDRDESPTVMDSGFSDQVGLTTSASEDHIRLRQGMKSNANIKRRVNSRRPTSGTVKRKSIFSSSAKKPKTIRDRKTFDTQNLIVNQVQMDQLGPDDPDETTSAGGGSVTSEELDKREARRRRAPSRPRSKLTFSRGEDIRASESRSSPRPKKTTDVDTPVSVTQAMQASMRKYQLERTIFQELLELKRLQIRAGKANEQVLVKRLADNYRKAGLSINFREYDGPYTFRNFEKYLYDQLRLLQANRRLLPRFAPSDDLEKLSVALKKMNATKLPFLDDIERSESSCDHQTCTHTTHRCHHAAHAYTGVPCAAYIGKGRKNGFLPRVNPLRSPGPTQKDPMTRSVLGHTPSSVNQAMQISISPRADTQSPLTLEVQQGANTQVFSLPTQSLDPTKNYYVSLSIKPNPSPSVTTSPVPNRSDVNQALIDDSGSISAPPPPAEPDSYVDVDIDRDKHNKSL